MRLALALALTLGIGATVQTDEPSTSVALDVLVSDARGRAVETLTAADFHVSEGGVPRPIESVRFVRATPSQSSASHDVSAIDASSRLFGILLDEYHVSPGPSADGVRDALVRFVKEDLRPGDWVAVTKPLDSLPAITLTADRDAAVQAIEAFDPRRGDYAPRTSFEREFIAGAPARIDAAREQIVASSINALASYLGRFAPMRKTLIVVSEGVPARGPRRGERLLPGFATGTLTANRGHVAIYAMNPADEPDPQTDGVTRDDWGGGDALRALASETSGREMSVAADPRAALLETLADASGYYVLTVPRASPEGGDRFHPVDVTVSRRDAVVRARRGYWSATVMDPDRRPDRSERASLLSAFSSRLPRRTSPLIRSWFGMGRGDAGETRISFVWEPAPRVPGDRGDGAVPARIALTVTTLDGQPVFDGVVRAAGTQVSATAEERSRVSFQTAAGRLLVQMSIQDVAARVVDREVRDLVVDGFPGPVSLGTAEVLRARTAREQQALAADPEAMPVAARQFSRAERLIVRMPVFTSGEVPRVSARLVSSFGGVMRQLTASPTPSRPGVFQFDLPLAALATGAYSVELQASTSSGEARDSLPIRVTP